ncbi:hypothetical protein OBBRIDRAFT_890037 [Obba rivulosa]|uniref:Aminoglycoside phosphotransferase domain-containing protein n=1 Tax=Obba rivulosa TaxID=1052685 RepID=A0A8E2DHG6_9APHY|nr:hypothetical protein OBBRIDRAFT_890037 [Obba rivulosa]
MDHLRKSSSSIRETEDDIKAAHATLEELETILLDQLDELDPALLRCIPSHDDFGPQNVFLDSDGRICGLIDWEFHSVRPAILAVNYPNWLRTYVNHNAPDDSDNQFTFFNMEDPAVAESLRIEYEQVVHDMEPDYLRALKEGSVFRSAEK